MKINLLNIIQKGISPKDRYLSSQQIVDKLVRLGLSGISSDQIGRLLAKNGFKKRTKRILRPEPIAENAPDTRKINVWCVYISKKNLYNVIVAQ